MESVVRVEAIIEYIESHLKEEMELDDLVRVANYSRYHLIRIFNVMTGETPYAYLKKRRLSESVISLLSTQQRIIDIAFEYQFNSQEAFTRAFKDWFGINPGDYRKTPYVLHTLPRIRIDPQHFIWNKEEPLMEPKIIKVKEFKVLGIVRYGDGKDGEFNRVWGKWHDQNQTVDWKDNRVGYGLNFYPPDFKSMDEHYQYYMPCMEVENFNDIPMHMVAKKIPACTCAVFTHKGKAMNIGDLYHQIFYQWLPNSGYELSEPFCIEVYDTRNDRWKSPDDPDSETDLYIPIQESA